MSDCDLCDHPEDLHGTQGCHGGGMRGCLCEGFYVEAGD